MQKVYRLLRNNQETGPYSLEEILQLNLKPFDLVWVEGRSAAWRYPSEIETLKPFVPEAARPQTPFEPVSTAAMETGGTSQETPVIKQPSKNIFVSMPGQSLQPQRPIEQNEPKQPAQPAFEQRAQNFSEPISPYAGVTKEPEVIHTNYVRSLNDVEEDYANWTYRQKTRKKSSVSKKDLVIAAVIVALIIGGYFIISKPSIVEPLSLQRQTVPSFPTKETTGNSASEIPGVQEPAPSTFTSPDEKKQIAAKSKGLPILTSADKIETTGENQQGDITNEETTEVISQTTKETSQNENVPVIQKEKKKKLGEVIRGIFSKKDKTETVKQDPEEDDHKPATNRQATRRNTGTEENTNETSSETLANMIDISSNEPDNWMMGVSGLKVTLRNRNNVVLQTAAVQVLYYDENDQVIDRKNIYFHNVPARGKTTLAAPDHKFADHVEFKLAAVTAKDDRYVNN